LRNGKGGGRGSREERFSKRWNLDMPKGCRYSIGGRNKKRFEKRNERG